MNLAIALYLAAASVGVSANLASPRPRAVTYDGFSVFRVPVGNDASRVAEVVDKLQLETWKSFRKPGAYADVVVPPEQREAFDAEVAGMEGVEIMHEDLAASIAAELEPAVEIKAAMLADSALAAVNTTWYRAYHSYADHLSYLRSLAAQYPSNAEIATSGSSLQGNTITGLHIYGSAGPGVNPAVVFHGTVHAREWITTMVSPGTPFYFICTAL